MIANSSQTYTAAWRVTRAVRQFLYGNRQLFYLFHIETDDGRYQFFMKTDSFAVCLIQKRTTVVVRFLRKRTSNDVRFLYFFIPHTKNAETRTIGVQRKKEEDETK